jgi:hypothetical protein
LAPLDPFTLKNEALSCPAANDLHWAFEAQEFLDCVAQQLRVLPEKLELVLVAQEYQHAVRNEVSGGLGTSVEQGQQVRDEFCLADLS